MPSRVIGALVDGLEAVDRAAQGRLAGARRADHHDDLAARDGELDVLEGVELPEVLLDAAQHDEGLTPAGADRARFLRGHRRNLSQVVRSGHRPRGPERRRSYETWCTRVRTTSASGSQRRSVVQPQDDVRVPEHRQRGRHVGARDPAAQGDVRQPPGVLRVATSRRRSSTARASASGTSTSRATVTRSRRAARCPRRATSTGSSGASSADGPLLVLRAERGCGHQRQVRAVGGAAVVELGGQAGVAQGLPVTAYGLVAGSVRQQLEGVQARHAASLGPVRPASGGLAAAG